MNPAIRFIKLNQSESNIELTIDPDLDISYGQNNNDLVEDLENIFGNAYNTRSIIQIINSLSEGLNNLPLYLSSNYCFTHIDRMIYFNIIKDNWTKIRKKEWLIEIDIKTLKFYYSYFLLTGQTNKEEVYPDTLVIKKWFNEILNIQTPQISQDNQKVEKYSLDLLILWYRFNVYWKNNNKIKELESSKDTKAKKFNDLFQRTLVQDFKYTNKNEKLKKNLDVHYQQFQNDLEIIKNTKISQLLYHQFQNDIKTIKNHFPNSKFKITSNSQPIQIWLNQLLC